MKKIILFIVCSLLLGATMQAQDTRRMYFGLSVEPSWGWISPGTVSLPLKGPRLGINAHLQSFKYVTPWLGFYFGVSLFNTGGHISTPLTADVNMAASDDVTYRLQYISLPLGFALTTPLKRNFQFNFQFGMALSLNVDGSAVLSDDTSIDFKPAHILMPVYQITGSLQYHIGQDVYLHLGPSCWRSFTGTSSLHGAVQQSIGLRAGIIF